MSALDELKGLLIEIVGLDSDTKITLESSFTEDLGADSLNLVELVMALEERFGLEISDEDAEKLITVKDALEYLKGKGVKVD